MPNCDKRGIILFIVIGIIMVVVILSTVTLRIVAIHSRLIHHQVSRVQAMYAAKAGIVYALEKLRLGDWVYTVSPAHNDCAGSGDCPVTDSGFPSSIKSVMVIFCPSGSKCPPALNYCTPPPGYSFCINSTADFLYTP